MQGGKVSSGVKTEDGAKNSLKESTRKLKMVDRQVEIGSLSTVPMATGNSFSSKKELRQIVNKKKEMQCENNSKRDESGLMKYGSREKRRQVIEIEVFMPIVDVENNTIVYPESQEPVMWRYYANEKYVLKRKEYFHKNVHSAKKSDELSPKKSYLQSKMTKCFKENSNKNIPNPRTKSEEANTVKNTSIERKSAKDVRNGKEFQNVKIRNDRNNPPLTFDGTLKCQEKPHDNPTLTRARTRSGCERKFTKNLSSSITGDAPEYAEETADELLPHTGTTTEWDSNCKSVLRKPSYESKIKARNPVEKFRSIHELVYCPVTRLSIEPPCISKQKCDPESSDNRFVKRKTNAYVIAANKHTSSKVKKIDLSSKAGKESMGVSIHMLDLGKKESSSSVRETLNKIEGNQNGLRRIVPPNSFRKSSDISKWGRNAEDGLNMQCWIERCQYLLDRDQQLQKTWCVNPWRSS